MQIPETDQDLGVSYAFVERLIRESLNSSKNKSDIGNANLESENSKSHLACVIVEPESAPLPLVDQFQHETQKMSLC
ncbi:hypothetical protein SESBI_48787 [Sesbania bispinosa]|nr:hypothetical protein SESBI_48787 [Sesbania bispinosa]